MPDSKKCPLCNKENLCAVSLGKSIAECWCNSNEIKLIDIKKVLSKAETKEQCICQQCLLEAGCISEIRSNL